MYKKNMVTYRVCLRNGWVFLATCGGVGSVRYFPGTAGTLLAAIGAFFIKQHSALWFYVFLTLFMQIAGVIICDKAGKILGDTDHGAIVWDEAAAFFLMAAFIPVNVLVFVLAFLLFRILDIVKPFPICWFESRIPGGLGVMLDDTLAALIALPVIQLFYAALCLY